MRALQTGPFSERASLAESSGTRSVLDATQEGRPLCAMQNGGAGRNPGDRLCRLYILVDALLAL